MSTNMTEQFGFHGLNSAQSEFNKNMFVIQQQMAKMQTCLPVKIVAVRNAGLSPVGYVDVIPQVDLVRGDGTPLDHGTLTNLPYFRLQGGSNAIVIDPEVGDLGIACFCSRDISKFKNARKKSPPASMRSHDFSDGVYIGGILNAAPTQYIQFNSNGITVHSPTKVTIEAPTVIANCTTATIEASGTATVHGSAVRIGASGDTLRELVDSRMVALFNGHTHPGDSGGTTGVPNQQMSVGTQTTTTTKVG